ncbi:hypothetical protein [Nocardia yamanashiensis]|uniref:hypothetical protein n=1 Tax=Nocardia yamanashiensis TaxID=209247 RepID=UPI000831BC71|nr:hypothetical protein [Nocardia yamanashiensis]
MALHAEEQIVAESTVLAEAAAQALIAARREVQRWAAERERQAAAEVARGQRRGRSANAAAGQERSPRRGLLSRVAAWFRGRGPAAAAEAGAPTQVEALVAKWAASEAQREYAAKVARAWEQSVAELDQQLRDAGMNPETARAIAGKHVDIDVEKVKRLAAEYTLAELTAAGALVADRHNAAPAPAAAAAEKAEAAKEETATQKAPDAEATPQKQASQESGQNAGKKAEQAATPADTTATARKSTTCRSTKTTGKQAASGKTTGEQLVEAAKPRRSKKASGSEAEAEQPQQLPPETVQGVEQAAEAAVGA